MIYHIARFKVRFINIVQVNPIRIANCREQLLLQNLDHEIDEFDGLRSLGYKIGCKILR